MQNASMYTVYLYCLGQYTKGNNLPGTQPQAIQLSFKLWQTAQRIFKDTVKRKLFE